MYLDFLDSDTVDEDRAKRHIKDAEENAVKLKSDVKKAERYVRIVKANNLKYFTNREATETMGKTKMGKAKMGKAALVAPATTDTSLGGVANSTSAASTSVPVAIRTAKAPARKANKTCLACGLELGSGCTEQSHLLFSGNADQFNESHHGDLGGREGLDRLLKRNVGIGPMRDTHGE